MKRLRAPVIALLVGLPALAAASAAADTIERETLIPAIDGWREHPRVHAVIVAHGGETVVEEVFAGPGLDTPVNVKSLGKTFMAALTGAAIHHDSVEGIDQPVTALLGSRVPDNADARIEQVTVAHLLSMSSGLERTSGPGYGAWVNSANWVEYALTRPFVDAPGERMQYSTGDFHILAAALTQASGRSVLSLTRNWIGEPLGIRIPPWDQDPQGVYFGGNNMLLSPRALVRLGELYRHDGVVDGQRVLPRGWVESSWTPRVRSPWSGDQYGFGWFIRRFEGTEIYYSRGYGGQMLYVVPALELTVAITADPTPPSPPGSAVDRLHAVLEQRVVRPLRGRDWATRGRAAPATRHLKTLRAIQGTGMPRPRCPRAHLPGLSCSFGGSPAAAR